MKLNFQLQILGYPLPSKIKINDLEEENEPTNRFNHFS